MGMEFVGTLARVEIDPCSAFFTPLTFLAVAWSVLLRERRIAGGEADPPRCGDCRYELTGLDRGAVCPECGSASRLMIKPHLKRVLVRARLPIVATAFVVMVVYILIGDAIALLPAAMSYRSSGYSWDVSMNAARIRDGDDMIAIFPLSLGIALAPLSSLMRHRVGQWIGMAVLIIVAAAVALAWWWLSDLIR